MVFENIVWNDDKKSVNIIDQTRLPVEKFIKELNTIDDMWEAIKMLRVRGAPLIGVSAGYGIALAVKEINKNNLNSSFIRDIYSFYSNFRRMGIYRISRSCKSRRNNGHYFVCCLFFEKT